MKHTDVISNALVLDDLADLLIAQRRSAGGRFVNEATLALVGAQLVVRFKGGRELRGELVGALTSEGSFVLVPWGVRDRVTLNALDVTSVVTSESSLDLYRRVAAKQRVEHERTQRGAGLGLLHRPARWSTS